MNTLLGRLQHVARVVDKGLLEWPQLAVQKGNKIGGKVCIRTTRMAQRRRIIILLWRDEVFWELAQFRKEATRAISGTGAVPKIDRVLSTLLLHVFVPVHSLYYCSGANGMMLCVLCAWSRFGKLGRVQESPV